MSFSRYAGAIARSAGADQDEQNVPDSSQGIAKWILKRILSRLRAYEHFEKNISHPVGAWELVRAFVGRGPPDFSDYYYIYGLLDCASQLARILNNDLVPPEFKERMKRIILKSRDPSFRWKAVSFP